MVGARRGGRGLSSAEPGVRFGRRTYFVLGLFLLLQSLWFLILNTPHSRVLRGDEVRYLREALSIASGVAPAPEFLWPPLQKWFLGGVFALFGAGPVPLAILQTLLLFSAGLIFWRLVLGAGLGTVVADAALAFFLLDPQIGSFAFCLWPEVTYLFLFFSALGLLFLRNPPTLHRLFLGGICLGLALLAKSVVGPFLALIVAAVVFAEEGVGAGIRFSRASIVVAGLTAVLVPVIVSNGVRHGTWGLGSSATFNLRVGLEDPRSRTDYDSVVGRVLGEYMNSGSTPAERDRVAFSRVKERVAARGLFAILRGQLEKQYVRLFDKNSFFTDQLLGGRWRPQEVATVPVSLARAWAWGIYALTLIFAGSGLFLLSPVLLRKTLWFPLIYLLYSVGILLLLHVKTRYRVAFLPCLDILAGVSVAELFRRNRAAPPSWDVPAIRARLAAGTMLAALLLWLAFGP